MKRLPALLCCLLLSTATVVHANEQTREVQTELKNQGFFYGEIDGKSSAELSAAIRRYQIRNGLEVSGQLNAQTLESLGVESAEPPVSTTPARPAATPAPPIARKPEAEIRPREPVNLRRTESAARVDDEFAREETARPRYPRDPSIIRPPAPLDDERTSLEPSEELAEVFNDTPYETAPRVVQEDTLRRAQSILRSRGLYRAEVDGLPGPATQEAILSYQRNARLPMSGHLDLETLNALRLLPGRGKNPPLRRFNSGPERVPGAPARGSIWVE